MAKEPKQAQSPATQPTAAPTEHKKKARVKKGPKKHVAHGKVFVQATFNNTLITITDMNGEVLCWSSSGKMGFRGSKKGTSFAAQRASQDASQQASQHGLKSVEVYVKGPGSGRESAVRGLEAAGIRVTSIRDVTGVPHNGCRPRKRRRV